ncbi:hypothetical protein EV141_0179 [Microcella putealis]|uniref:Uncharacterized protein n=1 Tax=Microcella putealis TaxID=337005 RepID=A0A4Q7LV53_9MICO|nr:hypothetical protein [Microcella putealis]RZS58966.1 hypothetical protein EV141_0179 [Microcella putealis]TQM23992.1 hypothetical protein BJ957_1458 [Microcella putealis]
MLKPTEDGVEILKFYDRDGVEIEDDQGMEQTDMLEMQISFYGSKPVTAMHMTRGQLEMVSAWFNFLGAHSMFQGEAVAALADEKFGLPKGTTFRKAMSGNTTNLTVVGEAE